jgi:hypothetical protein
LIKDEERLEEYQDEDEEGRPLSSEVVAEAELGWNDGSKEVTSNPADKFKVEIDAKEDFGWGGEDLGFDLPKEPTKANAAVQKGNLLFRLSYFLI